MIYRVESDVSCCKGKYLQEAAKRRQEMAATKQAEQRSHEAPGDFFEAPKKITVSPEKDHGTYPVST